MTNNQRLFWDLWYSYRSENVPAVVLKGSQAFKKISLTAALDWIIRMVYMQYVKVIQYNSSKVSQ